MTKVELHLRVGKLDSDALVRLSGISSIYGILRVTTDPHRGELIVEFDATRLGEKDVTAALARIGIPAEPLTQ